MRYDLEMNHWLKSFKSAPVGMGGGGGGSSAFAVIGMCINLILVITWLILLAISSIITWTINLFAKEEKIPQRWTPTNTNDSEKLTKMWKEAKKIKVDY
jgi:hypothetical protein